MKTVVHISTSDKQGGAAIAAWRLHDGLKRLGVDSRVVSRYKTWPGPEVSSVTTPFLGLLDLFHERRVVPEQAEGATYFSLSPVSIPLLEHPWIAEADIVHLHWVARFIAPEDISALYKAGKTVFWTFHDQWPYTGGCHYVGGTSRQEYDWDGTAQIGNPVHQSARQELERKRKAFTHSPIHVIAPSRWMAEEAAASGIFRPEQIHTIPYGLSTRIFHPAKSDIDPDVPQGENGKIKLLFGCQALSERRKGLAELHQALIECISNPLFSQAVHDGRIEITTFGSIPVEISDMPMPVTHLGTLSNEFAVAEVLRASSAFVCPTLEDNLPNIVMESIACGCPVIAFDTGGVPDMIEHGRNGLLSKKGDIALLAEHITSFCLNHLLRAELRNNTHASARDFEYSLEKQASRMIALYESTAPDSVLARGHQVPENMPPLEVNATICPQLGTELVNLLIAERVSVDTQRSSYLQELYNSNVNHIVQFEKERAYFSDQISLLNESIEVNQSQNRAKDIRINELNQKISRFSDSKNKLKSKIEDLQKKNDKLKKAIPKKTGFQRVRKYILRKIGKI